MTPADTLQRPPLAAGSTIVPGYLTVAHLCRTGWLDVYDAWSRERECRCVVKVLRPDRPRNDRLRERLLREGRWLQSFTHPHLVRAYHTAEEPQPYVVLESLTGETLARAVERRRHGLAAADLAQLGVHLCSAVHYLHGHGLLHLDLKPANVVIDCRRAKVLDLSTARPPGPGRPGVGTFCYLAPEQARGGMLTAAADVWGIGITLYEAATGDVPFEAGGTTTGSSAGDDTTGDRVTGEGTDPAGADSWYPQLEEQAPPVSTRRRLRPDLAAAIDACLHPRPDARPTVPALAAALDATLARGRHAVRPAPGP